MVSENQLNISQRTLLGVSSPGHYKYMNRALSATQMRRLWLTGLINGVHTASRQTYESRRIHTELTIGMKLQVSERLVAELMSKDRCRPLAAQHECHLQCALDQIGAHVVGDRLVR